MPKKHKGGKYNEWLEPEKLILLEGWRRDGLDYDQIAHNMGIVRSTLSLWRTKFKDISDALKRGSEVSTYEIENALYKAAKGHFVEEVEIIETESDRFGKTITKQKRKRYIPPSVTAQIFILKNRRCDVWKDRQLNFSQNEGMLEALIDGLKETAPEEEVIETVDAETINPDQPEQLPGDNTA